MVRFPIPCVLVAVYLASACATLCQTPCGLAVTEGNCAALQHYEARVTERLSHAVPAWSDAKICSSLEGWIVRIRRHDDVLDRGCGVGAWRQRADPKLPCIIGEADPATKTITLAETNWESSAFAHEVVHVAGGVLTGDYDAKHCRWNPWLKAALSDLNGFEEWTGPEASCSR